MAERRMLSRKITDHDNFTSLPAAAQALYMHLVLSADDDGLCSQINIAMGKAKAKQKDLQALINQRYLLRFDSGVIAIKHWGMMNRIRQDRYHKTDFPDELSRLFVKPNGAYSLTSGSKLTDNSPQNVGQSDADSPQNVRQNAAEYRLGKYRLGKDSNESNVCNARTRAREEADPPDSDPDRWEEFWTAYPRKSGGDIREACMEYIAVIDHGVDPETLISAAKALADRTDSETFRYLPSAEKWLRNKGWLENPEAAKDTRTNNVFLQMYEDEYGGDGQ